MEALQGIATGISVTRNSGAPGAGTKATIRGLGTIGNSAPLYIVDGVSVGNIDYLNASDIECNRCSEGCSLLGNLRVESSQRGYSRNNQEKV